MDSLASKVKCSGVWRGIESADPAPGDTTYFKIGDTVPTDCYLIEVINVPTTGESLPQSNKFGDQHSRSELECFQAKRDEIWVLRTTVFYLG